MDIPHHYQQPAEEQISVAIPHTSLATKIFWFVFGILTLTLALFFIKYPPLNYGGDIAEYHGITESILKDHTIHLGDISAFNIKTYLQPAYLNDPGYYVTGRDGERWPVHFIFYSILAVPVRLLLKLLQLNELDTLRITNLVFMTIASWYILKTFLSTTFKKSVLLIALYLSPLVWFLYWPGPDVYYTVLLLVALFLFGAKRYIPAAIVLALSSWHSQPLVVLLAAALAYYGYTKMAVSHHAHETYIGITPKAIGIAAGVLALGFIPYLYNVYAFGVMTPWTIFKDGWTQVYGFGMHNLSLWKLFEQFFDLNYGLLWYAPVLVIFGLYGAIRLGFSDKRFWLLLAAMLGTCFFYQTNPAWHYGTAGFGPSRHILFAVPFFIYFFVAYIQPKVTHYIVIGLFVVTQLYILSVNGWLTPKLENTLVHSPLASYVLANYPKFYNPTYEIFVDRTNHTDEGFLRTAIFKDKSGNCTKAFVTRTDKAWLEKFCGKTPAPYAEFFGNPYTTKTTVSRQTAVLEATFWPDPASCGKDWAPSEERPFVCMKTRAGAAAGFRVPEDRLTTLKDYPYPGIWKLKAGGPVKVTIPPGYTMDAALLDGFYVNYK